MTSKKALEELERINSRQNNGKGDVWLEMIIDGIKKDLEVLEILKSYFNIWEGREGDFAFVIEFNNEPVIVITKEDIENKYEGCGKELKIKEWLENEEINKENW